MVARTPAARGALVFGTALLGLSAPLVAFVIGLRTFRRELAEFRPRRVPVIRPSTGLLAHARNVRFDAAGLALHGWFAPSKSGAAVILLHGSGATRVQVAPVAELLAQRGIGVFLYDSPGHGESEGAVRWSSPERQALRAALDLVSSDPSVDAGRVGVFGFSAGAAIATQVAATDTRVRALALAGAFGDPEALTRFQNRRWGPLSELPALWADAWAGASLDVLRPREVIGSVAPRSVLIIAAEHDAVVPREQTQLLYDAARGPKSFLVVPGAGHGDLVGATSAVVGGAVIDFFTRGLARSPSALSGGGT